MRETFLTAIKLILTDRLMTSLLIVLAAFSVIYSLYVGISLRPGDLQVAMHYTSYGETNYYRDQWYYLISFAVYGGVILAGHGLVAMKLYVMQKRQLAIAFVLFGYLLLIIAWITARSVLGVAFL